MPHRGYTRAGRGSSVVIADADLGPYVHLAAHPPRLSTAAAHPAPKPHIEEPRPIAIRCRWSRCCECAERYACRN
jgi:hypothetical protein